MYAENPLEIVGAFLSCIIQQMLPDSRYESAGACQVKGYNLETRAESIARFLVHIIIAA